MGLLPPPDEWEASALAATIQKTPSQVSSEEWIELRREQDRKALCNLYRVYHDTSIRPSQLSKYLSPQQRVEIARLKEEAQRKYGNR